MTRYIKSYFSYKVQPPQREKKEKNKKTVDKNKFEWIINAGLAATLARWPFSGPLRLVAQDVGFSVRKQGFDSPRGYNGVFRFFREIPFFIVFALFYNCLEALFPLWLFPYLSLFFVSFRYFFTRLYPYFFGGISCARLVLGQLLPV